MLAILRGSKKKNQEAISSHLTGILRTLAIYKEDLPLKDRINIIKTLIKVHKENPIGISSALIEELKIELSLLESKKSI